MKYCINCGTLLSDDAKFCLECGKPTANGAVKNDESAIKKEPFTAQPDDSENNAYINDKNKTTKPGGILGGTPIKPTSSDYAPPAGNASAHSSYYGIYNMQNVPIPDPSSGKLNAGALIWAIINIICCCMPLGVISLIFTVGAKNAITGAEEKKKNKLALVWNILATIGGFLLIALTVVIIAFATAQSIYLD